MNAFSSRCTLWMAMSLLTGLVFVMPPAMAAATPGAVAAQPSAATSATGDPWMDATLADIDRYAARYPDAFVDELHRYYAAPRELVADLLGTPQWTAGDVYFACALARIAAQPCRAVATLRMQAPARPWATIAQHFGITADSAQFHELKRGVVRSYERWARPLSVDASLHAEFPQHALYRAPAASTDPRAAPDKSVRDKRHAR